MRTLPRIVVAVLTAALLPSGGAFAHGPEGSGGAGRPSDAGAAPSKEMLKTWSALLAARDGIAEDIEVGSRRSIQRRAEAVPQLAQTLIEQTDNLSDPKRARVKSSVTQLSKVAEHLHGVPDAAGDDVLRGDLKRLDRALRLIRAQFPKGSLPLGERSAAGHASGHHD